MGIISKVFGTYSDREIKRIRPLVEQIESLGEVFSNLTEDQLKNKTNELKQRLQDGASLDDILPEAFATVREAAWRVLGMKHFNVQLIGGIVLHQGRIAEMKTGEGKTLVATLPIYLNALTGRGVHVVTVNDYLATRDSEWMGKIYQYLGLSVGLIVHGIDNDARRQAYSCDITYGTNNEFGFDYLRDNMVLSMAERVQRELHYAIVDEVDSILIDEARTPLIISGQGTESSELYQKADEFVRRLKVKVVKEADVKDIETEQELKQDCDYLVDEKAKTAVLTSTGINLAENYFGIDNLSDESNYEINHHINNALRAHGTMHIDHDYVVKDGEVIIVDDFTGRLMEGRRYSNGLHQAIEAKEGVKVERENKTLATITFQNYFRMFQKLSGMTGTAMTEEDEFRQIYQLDVISIPTNRPMIRKDESDAVFKSVKGKYSALVSEVAEAHAKGQPILIGTISVEKSEVLSKLFTRMGLPHNVLNAKQHAREAEIVAQAGRFGAITIATNMAGRGTDIVLGGNPEHMAKQEMRKQGVLDELIDASTAHNATDDEEVLKARELFAKLESQYKAEIASERDQVTEAGGLYIIGTERHESRRIDDQLRGRAGRQGDPGRSRFFISAEDDLMRLFGGDRMERIFEALRVEEDMAIENSMLTKIIENAQRKVESRNFSIRKNVLEYDDVMNQQRNLIYGQRRQVLEGQDLHPTFQKMVTELMERTMFSFVGHEPDSRKWDGASIGGVVRDFFGELPGLALLAKRGEILDGEEFSTLLADQALERLNGREDELGSAEMLKEAERIILLRTVDNHWMDHIDAMDDLRDSIGMRGYAQHDPVIEYKKEGYQMFESMTQGIQEDATRLIMRAQLVVSPEAQAEANRNKRPAKMIEGRGSDLTEKPTDIKTNAEGGKVAPAKREQIPGRNDPCWCGSGKKYKNCHLQSDNKAD